MIRIAVVVGAAGIAFAPVASADPADPSFNPTPEDLGHAGAVCMSLQSHPTDQEVAWVASRLVYRDGYTPQEAGMIMRWAVNDICPQFKGVVDHATSQQQNY
jgi:hypothetical protein